MQIRQMTGNLGVAVAAQSPNHYRRASEALDRCNKCPTAHSDRSKVLRLPVGYLRQVVTDSSKRPCTRKREAARCITEEGCVGATSLLGKPAFHLLRDIDVRLPA